MITVKCRVYYLVDVEVETEEPLNFPAIKSKALLKADAVFDTSTITAIVTHGGEHPLVVLNDLRENVLAAIDNAAAGGSLYNEVLGFFDGAENSCPF